MFKQVFVELQERFNAMLVKYWELRKACGVEIVTLKHFDSLPTEFRNKRELVLDEYLLFFRRSSMDAFLEIPQCDYEVEVDEAMEVFLSINANEEFKIFLDLLEWMPMHKQIMRKLFNEKHVDRLRSLLDQTPMISEAAPDMDVGYVLSASANHDFGNLVIMLFSVPTTDEHGVTTLQGVKDERIRIEMAQKMIKDELP